MDVLSSSKNIRGAKSPCHEESEHGSQDGHLRSGELRAKAPSQHGHLNLRQTVAGGLGDRRHKAIVCPTYSSPTSALRLGMPVPKMNGIEAIRPSRTKHPGVQSFRTLYHTRGTLNWPTLATPGTVRILRLCSDPSFYSQQCRLPLTEEGSQTQLRRASPDPPGRASARNTSAIARRYFQRTAGIGRGTMGSNG